MTWRDAARKNRRLSPGVAEARKARPVSEVRLSKLFEANPDAVVVIDEAGVIVFANSRVEAVLGYRPQDLIGKLHSVLVPARRRDAHAGHVRSFMDNPTPRMMGVGLELVANREGGIRRTNRP